MSSSEVDFENLKVLPEWLQEFLGTLPVSSGEVLSAIMVGLLEAKDPSATSLGIANLGCQRLIVARMLLEQQQKALAESVAPDALEDEISEEIKREVSRIATKLAILDKMILLSIREQFQFWKRETLGIVAGFEVIIYQWPSNPFANLAQIFGNEGYVVVDLSAGADPFADYPEGSDRQH